MKTPDILLFMKNKRILLVEDDIIAQRIEKDVLENLGFSVDIVADGQHALELAQQHQYHSIFIDISLPDMDGFTLAETLRQELKPLPTLIALSVHADELHRQCARDSGMTEFVRKPLTLDICQKLLETV